MFSLASFFLKINNNMKTFFKLILTKTVVIVIANLLSAQNTPIYYGRCNGCTGSTPAYDIVPYTISDVTSDYGMRVVSGSKFHQGIDYVPAGSVMGSGDAVIAIEGGTIKSLQGSGLKRVVIDGGSSGHIFAYLHLFDNDANITLPYRLGGFVLIRIPNTNGFAIIDIANVTAYSQSSLINRVVSYNNVNYTTTDQIPAGRAFAPIGKSGGVPYHLHVALLESGTADRSMTESIDPWNVISSHNNMLFTRFRTRKPVNFSANTSDHNVGIDNWGDINIDYEYDGNTKLGRNVLEVEVSMPNAATVPNSGHDQYSNVVMNEDKIEVQIKKDNESTFQNIIGSENFGFFQIDPKGGDIIYPNRIYSNYGGLGQKEAGIIPFAYRSGSDNITGQHGSYIANNNPYDYYLFPDFYSRIRKNHLPSGKLILSDTPIAARYNDGKYNLRSSVTNIHDIRFNSIVANFNLDNFMPFLSKITAKYSNKKFYEIQRLQFEGYDVQNDGYVSNYINDIGFQAGFIPFGSISIEIETTEPMNGMKMAHKKSNNTVFSHEISMVSIGLNKYKAEFSSIGYGIDDIINVRFLGQDVSSNQLVNIYESSIHNSILKKVSIPTRNGNQPNDWFNLPQNSGYDQIDVKLHLCSNRTESFIDQCDVLLNLTSSLNYNSCKDATIRLSGLGNSPTNYRITWSDNAGNILPEYNDQNAISIVKPGTYCYNVEAIDDCCNTEGCVEVIAEEFLRQDFNLGIYKNTDCDKETVLIWDSKDEYSYKWTNSSNEWNAHTVTNPTVYAVTITNKISGCQQVETFEFLNHQFTLESTVTQTSCDEDGKITLNIGQNTPGLELNYLWSDGSRDADRYDLAPGQYCVTVTNGNQSDLNNTIICTKTKCFDIIAPPFIVNENIFQTNCSGLPTSVILQAIANNSLLQEFIYKWDDGSTLPEKEITHSGQLCYTVTHVATGSCKKGCVIVQPIHHVSVTTATLPICTQGTGKITTNITGGSLPYSFKWSNGATTKDLSGLNSGTYILTVTDKNNCTSSKSVIIEVINMYINIDNSAIPQISCTQYLLTPLYSLSGPPNISTIALPLNYKWSSGQNTPEILVTMSGTYCVTVTSANLCTNIRCFDIRLAPEILATASPNTACPSATGNGSIIVNAFGGTPPYLYSYYPGPINVTNSTISALIEGNYRVVVTDVNGCSNNTSIIIKGKRNIEFLANVKNQCSTLVGGIELSFQEFGFYKIELYRFISNVKTLVKQFYGLTKSHVFNELEPVEYLIEVSDPFCGFGTQNIKVNASNNNSMTDIKSDIKCVFTGKEDGIIKIISVVGGSYPYSYKWSNGITNDEILTKISGNYIVTVTDANGCSKVKSFNLPESNIRLLAEVNVQSTNNCTQPHQFEATVNILSGNPPFSIQWYDGSHSNSKLFPIGVDAPKFYTVTDACGFTFTQYFNTRCDILCEDNCITVYKTGKSWCTDFQWDNLSGEWSYDEIKIVSNCPDGIIREVDWLTGGHGETYKFIGKESIYGDNGVSIEFFNGGLHKFSVKNLTSGCSKIIELPIPNKCFNLAHWLDDIFGGGNPNLSVKPKCVSVKFSKLNRSLDNMGEGPLFTMNFDNPNKTDCMIEMTISNLDLKTYVVEQIIIPPGKSVQIYSGNFDSWGLISSGDVKIDIRAFCDEVNCRRIIKTFKDDNFNNETNEKIVCGFLNKYILYHKKSDSYISVLESKQDSISYFAQISNLFGNYIEQDLTDMPVKLKNVKFLSIDFNNNLYVLNEQDQSKIQKIDTLGKVMWTTDISPFKVLSLSVGLSGEINLFGYDPDDNVYYSKFIKPDGSYVMGKPLLLPRSKYDKILQSDSTLIAFDQSNQILFFSSELNSVEKQFPQGVTIKDINTLENGNILAAGDFNGLISVGSISYDSDEYDNAIFITYDKVGNILTSQSVQNYRDETVQGIATKGNEEVAYHGRYKEIVYYAPDPADNVIDSCIFVNIISLVDTSCTLLPPMLSLDETACKLTLSSPEPDVIYTLHEEVDGVWEEVNGAAFPYQPEANGRYRASAKKEGCTTAFSDIIEVNCLKIPLLCDITLLDLTYDTLKGIFTVYWGETAGGVDSIFGNNIDKTLITSTITTFVKYQISYTWVKYIRYDSQGTVYIFGTDGTTKSFVTTVTTSGVTTTTWYQDVILHDIIWRPVLYQYSLLMYDKILNQYTHQIRRLTGQLISTENLGDFQSGKFTFELLQYHKAGYYTNVEYSSAQTSIRWYMGPTIYLTNLPPAVRIKRIQKWSQDRWMVSTEYTGTIIINGTTYTSLGYNTVMFIWYDGQGNVIKVTEIKHSRDEFISHVSTDGIKKVAYTGTYRDTIYNNTYPNGYMIEECAFMDGFDVEFNTPAPIVVPTLSKTDRVPKSSQEFRFYPNPFSKGINLDITSDIAEEVNIETYNMVGALMFTTKLDLQQGQNVRYMDAFERIPAGVYMVKIKSPTREHMTRVIRIE
jgi:hypothetical protein